MKSKPSHHLRGIRRFLTLLLLAPLALGLAWANPMPSPLPAGNAKPINPDGTPRQTSKAASTVTKLPTIVVTAATRTPQTIETTATTTTVLTHKNLDDNKYPSLSDALQSVPGLSVVTTGMPGGLTSIFIHGMESRQTLVDIDGRRQVAGIDGQDDNLANLTLDNVEQVEVVRTPTSSVQGGSAMGGVINLVTLSGKGLTTPQSSVSEEIGSFQTFRENVQSRGMVGNFDYAVAGSRQDSIYPALSTGGLFGAAGFPGQADQYRNTAYRGNFGYQITPDVYVDLHTSYSNAYSSSTGPFNSPDPTASTLLENWNFSPEVVAKVTDFYSTKLYYTRDQLRQVYNDPFGFINNFGGQGWLTRTQINTDSVDWQNDFQIAHNWSITAGVQSDNHRFYRFDNGAGMQIFGGNQDNIGGYISSQWQPLKGLNVLSSGRYDHYSQFGGAFTWRQGVTYCVAPTQTTVHASVSRAFTPPTLQDTVYAFPPFYFPNPNLVPETDLGWEAGVEQPLWDNRITPSATYFHNDLHNSIQPSGLTVVNVGQATTDGVEVGLTLKPCSAVTAKIDYTYLNAVNDTAQKRLLRRPRNTVQFTGTWNPIAPLTLTLGGNWVLGRQDSDAFTFAQEAAPDYFVLRAAATYQINKTVSVWVRGENLTDANYQPVLGYYAPSVAGYGGLKISF